MSKFFVPGDDLDRARENMNKVLDLLDKAKAALPLEEALGHASDVTSAALDFDGRWSTGVQQLNDEAGDIKDALKQVVDAFTDADNQLGDSLTPKDKGGGNNNPPPGGTQ